MSNLDIIPSILAPTVPDMQALATKYQGLVRQVHLDFADGLFVPNRLPDVAQVQRLNTLLTFQAHLMLSRPESAVSQLLTDDRFYAIILHAESIGPLDSLFHKIKASGRQAILALNPHTPITALEDYLAVIDKILIMTVNPGFNGSVFLPATLDKVSQINARYPKLPIICDGGIDPLTIGKAVKAGASQVVVGSYFHKVSLDNGLRALRSSIDS